MKIYSVISLFLISSIFSASPRANQLHFNKTTTKDTYEYFYKWLDNNEQTFELYFSLPRHEVNSNFRHFKALRPSLLKMYSLRKLKQTIGQMDPRKGQIKLDTRFDRIEFELQSADPKWLESTNQELKQVYENSLAEYLHQQYYIEFSGIGQHADNTTYYKPDHRRFIEESIPLLTPLVEAINTEKPNATARQIAEYILPWLQTIPYNTIESRTTSSGAGYLPPVKVIDRNQGDCDSKVALMAAVMKSMFPRLRMAIIYVPQHALLGINVSHLQEDETLQIDGLDYTLLEPVGPALIEFATISDSSKRFIDSGNYQVELLYD